MTEISAVLELLCTFLLPWIIMKLGDLQGYLLSVLAEVWEACAPATQWLLSYTEGSNIAQSHFAAAAYG